MRCLQHRALIAQVIERLPRKPPTGVGGRRPASVGNGAVFGAVWDGGGGLAVLGSMSAPPGLLADRYSAPHLDRMSAAITRLNAALEGRYRIERELVLCSQSLFRFPDLGNDG